MCGCYPDYDGRTFSSVLTLIRSIQKYRRLSTIVQFSEQKSRIRKDQHVNIDISTIQVNKIASDAYTYKRSSFIVTSIISFSSATLLLKSVFFRF